MRGRRPRAIAAAVAAAAVTATAADAQSSAEAAEQTAAAAASAATQRTAAATAIAEAERRGAVGADAVRLQVRQLEQLLPQPVLPRHAPCASADDRWLDPPCEGNRTQSIQSDGSNGRQ